MNYGILTRIASIITGMIILVLLPLVIPKVELQSFYVIYSVLPIIAIFDFGLVPRVLATSNNNILHKQNIYLLIITRCTLMLIVTTLLINYLGVVTLKGLFFIEVSLILYYLSQILSAFIEGFYSYKSSYKIKFYSELSVIFSFAALFIFRVPQGWYLIVCLLMCRSIPTLLCFVYIFNMNMFSSAKALEKKNLDLKKFSSRVGIVTALGYFSGQATNWIVALNFTLEESLAYSQCFYLLSTLHSLVMSYLIYYQVTFKTSTKVYAIYLLVRNKFLTILTVSFTVFSALAFCILSILDKYQNIVMFNYQVYLLLYLYFLPLIYNHLTAIVYRINGIELLYYLSIWASLALISSFYLVGGFHDLKTVLIVNAMISIIVNVGITHIIVTKRGYYA